MDLGNFTIGENEINAGAISIPLIKGDKGDRGQKGDTGATGYSPVRGVDYWTSEDQETIISQVESDLEDELDAKVDKVEGKGLSTNDYDDTEKGKVATAIQPTDYARNNKGGVVKVNNTNYAITINNDGEIHPANRTYEQYQSQGSNSFISKGTLENVISGKGLGTYSKPSGGIPSTDMTSEVQASLGKADTALQEHQDLTDYVKNTDYATSSKGGVIKVSQNYGSYLDSNGILRGYVSDYQNYQSTYNSTIISKGTLENVITGKDLTTKAYVDNIVGDIESILHTLNTGSGV